MASTSLSRKCASQRSVRSTASGERTSTDSSASQVDTYWPGSTTSRSRTQALTPREGSHEATRERQLSPERWTHAPRMHAVAPSARCAGAWPTTSSVAPSSDNPESRYTWPTSGSPTTNGGFATIRSKRSSATGSNHGPRRSSTLSIRLAASVARAISRARGWTSVATTRCATPACATACTPEPQPRSSTVPTGVSGEALSSESDADPTPRTWSGPGTCAVIDASRSDTISRSCPARTWGRKSRATANRSLAAGRITVASRSMRTRSGERSSSSWACDAGSRTRKKRIRHDSGEASQAVSTTPGSPR